MKTLTRKQLESRKLRAVRFARDVREDDELADQIADESLEEYAQHRHIKVVNPRGGRTMPIPTRRELLDRIQELEEENEELQEKVESIAEIVGEDEEGDQGNE